MENFAHGVDKRAGILYNNGKLEKRGAVAVDKPEKITLKNKIRKFWQPAVIGLLCVLMAILDFVPFTYTNNRIRNGLISDTVPLILGSAAVIWLMIRGKSGLFRKPVRLLWFLPCLVIAIDNFPFCSYFTGKSELYDTSATDWVLFALYCAGVGVFEECVFRGILFPIMAGSFSADHKGFLKTYFLSSVVFGLMHLFNVFAGGGGAAVLQAGYSVLTGGLFAFALIRTKNILFCAFAHGLYDFCGLLLPTLGGGTVFDAGAIVTMGIISVFVAAFVLYSVWTYPESERKELYSRLGFGVKAENCCDTAKAASAPVSETKAENEAEEPTDKAAKNGKTFSSGDDDQKI